MPSPPVRVVAFDFGNVLCRFSHEQGCRQIASLAPPGTTAGEVYRWIFGEHRLEPLETGELSPAAFLQGLGGQFGVTDLQALRQAYQTIFERVAPACDLISRVRLPKLLASNTDPLHWEEIDRMFAGDFTSFLAGGLVRSFDVGHRKPAAEFYAAVVDRARALLLAPALRPDEILFVDDLPANCDAACRYGLQVHPHLDHDVAALEQVLRGCGALG